jgi:hypothetical protein
MKPEDAQSFSPQIATDPLPEQGESVSQISPKLHAGYF